MDATSIALRAATYSQKIQGNRAFGSDIGPRVVQAIAPRGRSAAPVNPQSRFIELGKADAG